VRASLVLVLLLVAGAILRPGLVVAIEQSVVPLEPSAEQRVEGVRADVGQRVDAVDPSDPQSVDETEPRGGVAKVASTVGQVALGIVGAGVAIGAMVASLLFF
jgi:hypothetical protein